MNIQVYKNYEAMSLAAANLLAAQVRLKPTSVLGLATGSTPIGLYRELIRQHQTADLDFSRVRTVNLDEYLGLAPDNPQSYHYFMREQLFSGINLQPENCHFPDGCAADFDQETDRYDQLCRELGIDLQILGIGRNGHIAFNEPADTFPVPTHVVDLTPSTIEANRRFFERAEDVPRKAITMGLGAIMSARRILLLAAGEEKAEAISYLKQGKADPQVPATILLLHTNVTCLVDEAAASRL